MNPFSGIGQVVSGRRTQHLLLTMNFLGRPGLRPPLPQLLRIDYFTPGDATFKLFAVSRGVAGGPALTAHYSPVRRDLIIADGSNQGEYLLLNFNLHLGASGSGYDRNFNPIVTWFLREYNLA